MSVLAFEDKSLLPDQDLVNDSRRMNTASEVNAAILQSQNLNKGQYETSTHLCAFLRTRTDRNSFRTEVNVCAQAAVVE